MTGGIVFRVSEAKRFGVVKAALEGKMSTKDAAVLLGLSTRQVKRIKKRVVREGPSGVMHGNRNKIPAHAFSVQVKDRIIAMVWERYHDFNFSHLSEILEKEEDIRINRETLRIWLRPLGFGRKIRKKPRHRKRRERSAQEGQMLFLDGSPHRWFNNEMTTLLLCTDDATGRPLYGLFRTQEDLEGCFAVCQNVFNRFGLPVCFYLDRASQFTTTRRGGIHVWQRDDQPTQFERAMQELSVRLIFADSPEARGRAERINQTFQDRLVAELRLRNITTAPAATAYLNTVFIPQYRFTVEPADSQTAWRTIPADLDLRHILSKRFERTVNKDNTVSVNRQIIQILPTKTRLSFVKANVHVVLWEDGSWHVLHPRHGELPCKPIPSARPAGALTKAQGRRPAGECATAR